MPEREPESLAGAALHGNYRPGEDDRASRRKDGTRPGYASASGSDATGSIPATGVFRLMFFAA